MPRPALLALALLLLGVAEAVEKKHHHHRHHHHRHHHHKKHSREALAAAAAVNTTTEGKTAESVATNSSASQVESSERLIMKQMQSIEKELAAKEQEVKGNKKKGRLEVNGPLPADFSELFVRGVAEATGCASGRVRLLASAPSAEAPGLEDLTFEAPGDVVAAVESQAADANSRLARGALHFFLVAHEEAASAPSPAARAPSPAAEGGIDIDTAMPYGELEPFGREDTAQELTESSIKESDAMVDQLERAEVAEEKRAVFRALTRLRGAAIASFDGVARAQTGSIDEYSKLNKWRKTHRVHNLAEDESDISKWAFPESADF